LGERGFGPESSRRRLRQKLPTAWIVAEVIIDDVAWVVARPLGTGARPFCVRGGSVEQVADVTNRLEYGEFLDALGAVATDTLSAGRFPAKDEPVRWEHVLPWLSRDQECRFADFLEWRHSSSGSDAPSLNVEQRQFIVRSVLGLISDDERAEQQTNARLVSEKREATQREPFLRHQAETDHARVSKALGVSLPLPSTPLFGTQGRAEVNRRSDALDEQDKELADSDHRDELRAGLERAVAEEATVKSLLDEAQSRLDWERAALAELAGGAQSALLADLPPARDFCNVPLSMARTHECPIARFRPVDLATVRSERTAAEELAARRQLVDALEREVAQIRDASNEAKTQATNSRRAFLSASTAYDEKRGNLLRERALLSQVAQLVDDAEGAAQQASAHADAVTRLAREIEESYERQEKLRSAQQAIFGRFSARFDYVVRAILGNEVTGRVDTSGRSLVLTVEEHGERDSAAIATVKLLAFDLAALVMGVEGDGAFPRFLLHDGPREADMAPDIYERVFLFVRELEKCFDGDPSFQYILTTTTQPPEQFLTDPWLRLQLAGMPAEQRLLRCDL